MAAHICYFSLAFVVVGLMLPGRSAAVQLCPSSCYCLGNNVDCSKQGLISVPKDLPSWVTRLELQYNGITQLSEDDFKGLANLTLLDLSNNEIRRLNVSVFRHLRNLETLKINKNKLVDVPKLEGLGNLKEFELNHNEIQTLAVEFLAYMPQLKALELNHNALTDIMPGAFPANNSLQKLILNNNNLESFEPGCLDNLTSLNVLKMNKNKINRIHKDLFKNLTKLETIEITKNRLVQIEGLTFQKLTELKVLKLRKNVISVIKDGAFWGLDHLEILQLEHNNISKVTQRWLYGLDNLEEIYLGHNQISTIDPEAWKFCQAVVLIDLSNNKLVTLRGGSFTQLQHLKKLYLTNNQILNIQDGVFRDLTELEELDLSNNAISWTIEDRNGVFKGLEHLEELRLERNKIRSIANNAFDGLTSLRVLKLKDNQITSIQSKAFESMINLQQLYFNSSALLCDCQLSWLMSWLLTKSFHNTVMAKCAHPPSLRGNSIFQINPDQFVCEGDYLKPVITVHPRSQVALRNDNITLKCEANSTEDSPIDITWKKDNVVLNNPNTENKVSIEKLDDGEKMINYMSLLHLRDIQDSAAGNYQCVFKNQLGSAYSRKANISIHVYPEFIKVPGDIIVKAGTTARLECSASGLPTPVIGWKKDGGDNFPAARERRMHVMPQDDIFFIVDVKEEDEGVYSCTANNSEGMISVNATLTVQRVPMFVRPMQSHKYAHEGNTAVLECMADGSPKPKITWLKNGKPLDINRRHFLAASNQLLIIVQTMRSDMGLYTCEMTNTLGTISGSTELTIMSNTQGPRGVSEDQHDNSGTDESTTTGIIIIAVVCCVVGTSLVWVIIIYQTRKRHEMYSATPTDETTLPGEIPGSGYMPDKEGGYSQAVTVMPGTYQQYQEYQMKESGYESSSGRFRAARAAAIFPSDVDEEECKQSVPLTMAEQHRGAHSPDNSISYPNSDSDSLKSSQSTSSTHTSGHQTLQTFHPVIKDSAPRCSESMRCENCERCRKVKTDAYRCHSLNRHSSLSPYQNGMMYADMHHGSQPQPPGRRRAASSTDMQLLECVCDSQDGMICPPCRNRLSPLYNPPVRLASSIDPNSHTYHVNSTSMPHPYSSKGSFYPCHSPSVYNTHDPHSRGNPQYFTNDIGNHRDGFHGNSIHTNPDVKDNNKNLKDSACIHNGHVATGKSDHSDSFHSNKVGRRHRSVERLPPVIPPKQHKHSHIHANKCSLPNGGVFSGNAPQNV